MGTAFKLQVDWICHDAYGDPVDVQLYRLDADDVEHASILRRFRTVDEAINWATKWLDDRGFDFWCNIAFHQRMDHKYVTLHPRPKGWPVNDGRQAHQTALGPSC